LQHISSKLLEIVGKHLHIDYPVYTTFTTYNIT